MSATLTESGRTMQIFVGNLAIIGSGIGLWPGRRQAIIWTNAGILLPQPLWTHLGAILIERQIISFKKMHLSEMIVCEMVAILSRP